MTNYFNDEPHGRKWVNTNNVLLRCAAFWGRNAFTNNIFIQDKKIFPCFGLLRICKKCEKWWEMVWLQFFANIGSQLIPNWHMISFITSSQLFLFNNRKTKNLFIRENNMAWVVACTWSGMLIQRFSSPLKSDESRYNGFKSNGNPSIRDAVFHSLERIFLYFW